MCNNSVIIFLVKAHHTTNTLAFRQLDNSNLNPTKHTLFFSYNAREDHMNTILTVLSQL